MNEHFHGIEVLISLLLIEPVLYLLRNLWLYESKKTVSGRCETVAHGLDTVGKLFTRLVKII